MSENRILKGLDQIRNFINPGNQLSRETVVDLIKEGMPVRLIGNTYYAHADNINSWFKFYTKGSMKDKPLEEIEKGS